MGAKSTVQRNQGAAFGKEAFEASVRRGNRQDGDGGGKGEQGFFVAVVRKRLRDDDGVQRPQGLHGPCGLRQVLGVEPAKTVDLWTL